MGSVGSIQEVCKRLNRGRAPHRNDGRRIGGSVGSLTPLVADRPIEFGRSAITMVAYVRDNPTLAFIEAPR